MTKAPLPQIPRTIVRASAAVVYAAAFFFFFLRYVPLVRPFQTALLPILFLAFLLAASDRDKGLLFFIFVFPLINNLPYFFGIFTQIPHAPTALLLFLAFFLGWLVNGLLPSGEKSRRQSRPNGPAGTAAGRRIEARWSHPVFQPLFLLGLLIAISGAVTFFRFACFFPFRADGIYELKTNILGVSAGGAIMSTLFSLLNYLSGFAFFGAAYSRLKSPALMKKALAALTASTMIALLFALFQKYVSVAVGNYPFWVGFNQINGTFKDPNSFGAFLAAVFPLLLGLAAAAKGTVKKAAFGATAALLLFVFPSVGARSAFLGLLVGLGIFSVFSAVRAGTAWRRKLMPAAAVALLISVVLGAVLVFSGRSGLAGRITRSLDVFSGKISMAQFFNRRTYFWTAARAMIADYPISGVGLGSYIIEMPNYLKDLELPTAVTDSALNYVLQVGSELGWLGLAALAWLVWEILKQCRRTWRGKPTDKGRAFLIAGALAGLAPFAVNFNFHTYIGSFEVKYMFWFLVAIVFALGVRRAPEEQAGNPASFSGHGFGPGGGPASAICADRTEVISGQLGETPGKEAGPQLQPFSTAPKTNRSPLKKPFAPFFYLILCPVVFAASLLWNSAHSLSLETRTRKYGIKQEFGLDKVEKTDDGREFRWTGRTAGLMLRVESETLECPILASHPGIENRPVSVEVSATPDFFKTRKQLNGIVLREGVWQTAEFNLSEFLGKDVILVFKVNRTWNPKKSLGVPDPRNLGIALGQIRWGRSPKGHP